MKHATKAKERILLSVANVAQASTTSLDVVGQKPFSRMVRLVCVLMVLKMLHVMDKVRIVVASPSQVFPSSKMASNPLVVGVFVLLRSRSRIDIVT